MPIEKINEILAATSAKHGVDSCLVYAVAVWESGLNPHAISTTGAVGLMALQPETARKFSIVDPFDPQATRMPAPASWDNSPSNLTATWI